MNRYWIYHPNSNKAVGPFAVKRLKSIKGFSLDALVAPDGTQDSGAWKPASDYEDIRRLFPRPPPLPGEAQPAAYARAHAPKLSAGLIGIVFAVLTTASLIVYEVLSRQSASAIAFAQNFPVGDDTLGAILSQQTGSWTTEIQLPPHVWRVIYRSKRDVTWIVDLTQQQLQPRTIDALTFSIPVLYAQYSKRVEAKIAGTDLGPIKEFERYKCGNQDCLEASAGLYARTAEFDTLPWFKVSKAAPPEEPEASSEPAP